MLSIDTINAISRAVMAGTPAEKVCKTDEEFAKYRSIKIQSEGWMKGYGIEMVNDRDET